MATMTTITNDANTNDNDKNDENADDENADDDNADDINDDDDDNETENDDNDFNVTLMFDDSIAFGKEIFNTNSLLPKVTTHFLQQPS